MKKSILFVLMIVFLSTNLYAEELHYHKEMWCLKPDGTPNGRTVVNEDGSIDIFDGMGGSSTDKYRKKTLQSVYEELAMNLGIPIQIPSKKTEYDSKEIGGSVTVEPISATQTYIYIWQEGGEDHILMTYNPVTKTTRYTYCASIP